MRRFLATKFAKSVRSAFALLSALVLMVFLLGIVLVAASLINSSLDGPSYRLLQARSQALLGLEAALVQLAEDAANDDCATFRAQLIGEDEQTDWVGVWPSGESAPKWLVSGNDPLPADGGDVLIREGNGEWQVPLVQTDAGAYAYAVEDLSLKAVTSHLDNLDELNAGWPDDIEILRQQCSLDVDASLLGDDRLVEMNWGVLSNPLDGGLKVALDADEAAGDTNVLHSSQWRDPESFILGRPLIWSELALLMGIYHGSDDLPQLGLAFWADAWNPYTLELPFNQRTEADFRLRIEAPTAVVRYFTSTGSLAAVSLLDLGSHTASLPIDTDLYGTMDPGEIRFITHYRMEPIAADPDADISDIQIDFEEGEWSFIFETFDGQLIQKIEGIPYEGFSERFSYNYLSQQQLTWPTAQWVVAWKRSEPVDLGEVDPRAQTLEFDASDFVYNPNMIEMQEDGVAFSSGDRYGDGQTELLFDLPEESVLSVGALRHSRLEDSPALTLGSVGAPNYLFDQYFFSTLPSSSLLWSQSRLLANSRLRVLGSPSLDEIRSQPAAYLLMRGVFNINSVDSNLWLSQLPDEYYHFEFQNQQSYSESPTQLNLTQRQTLASQVVQRLSSDASPWFSLSQFANEGVLPADLFARMAPYLCVRGDTFWVHAYGEAPASSAKAQLRALVQRMPELSASGQGRRYQVLKVEWLDELPSAQ